MVFSDHKILGGLEGGNPVSQEISSQLESL